MSSRKKEKWWQSFYDDTPFEFYLMRKDPAELDATIGFLTGHLELGRGALVFDQCCGLGSISNPLAALGYKLVGVDLCQKFIDMAAAEAKRKRLPARFFQGDACTFVSDRPCDAAFNWYTSFGYFQEDASNLAMLECAYQSLKPGGRFALEFLNTPMIIRNFKERMQSTVESPLGDIRLARRCRLDLVKGTMRQSWTWSMPDGSKVRKSSTLRAYMPCDIVRLMRQAGFRGIKLFGDLEGNPLTIDSGRLIALGRRPA